MYMRKKRSEAIWFVAPTAIIFLLLMIKFPIFAKEEKENKYVNATLTIFPSIAAPLRRVKSPESATVPFIIP